MRGVGSPSRFFGRLLQKKSVSGGFPGIMIVITSR